MKRHTVSALLAVALVGFLFVADGCDINPLFPPDIEYQPGGAGGAGSTMSSGGGGNGGSVTTTSSGGGSGGSMSCTCSDDANPCTDDLKVGLPCPDGDEKACHTLVFGRKCTQPNSSPGYCYTADGCSPPCQECADAACTDRCVGQTCATNDVCASQNCVDGYCCDSSCQGPCNACNRVPGACSQLPLGMAGDCPTSQLCGNAGLCIAGTGAALGALCTNSADCASGLCQAQICVSDNDQPCSEHIECASNLCHPSLHKCVSCKNGFNCPEGELCPQSGRCQVLPGQPSQNSAECLPPGQVFDSLTCTLPVMAPCTADFECIYHHCSGKMCSSTCSIANPCPQGTTCAAGKCLLLPGNYCVRDDQCQGPPMYLGKCDGFPRKCK